MGQGYINHLLKTWLVTTESPYLGKLVRTQCVQLPSWQSLVNNHGWPLHIHEPLILSPTFCLEGVVSLFRSMLILLKHIVNFFYNFIGWDDWLLWGERGIIISSKLINESLWRTACSWGLARRIRLCISKSAATISSSSSSSPWCSSSDTLGFVPLHGNFRAARCLARDVDLDQSMGIMFPKFPVMVHHTWHSFMISSWERT